MAQQLFGSSGSITLHSTPKSDQLHTSAKVYKIYKQTIMFNSNVEVM